MIAGGSTIEAQSQVFHEDIALDGLEISLSFSSRVPKSQDKGSGYLLPVNIVSDHVDQSRLKAFSAEVRIAGRLLRREWNVAHLVAPKSLSHTFQWDGKDAYGRLIVGEAKAKIKVGFHFEKTYHPVQGPADPAFGLEAEAGSEGLAGFPGDYSVTYKEYEAVLGSTPTYVHMGGWMVSQYHRFDTDSYTVFRGDGILDKPKSNTPPTVVGGTYFIPSKNSIPSRFGLVLYE